MTAVGIRLESVSARFQHGIKGEITAVRDVSLEVEPGKLVTLLGPSGCGKTTTLRMIAGFQVPSAGRVWIGEHDVTRAESQDRNIGFVFQNYALFPHLSVFENVAYGLRVQKRPKDAINAAVNRVLALVGLDGYERQMPHQLSGGEQQRVALARAIVIEPRVLLFDEPLSNLDAKLRVQMRSEIRDLQQRLGITAVYVTHDQEEAMAISDRIAVMHQGAIEQIGDAEELYRKPASVFVATFIGRSNLIPVVAEAVQAGGVRLAMLGQTHAMADARAGLSMGQDLLAVIRPEAIRIRAADAEGFPATVLTRVYLGEKVEYVVRIAGVEVQVARADPLPTEHFSPGSAVRIVFPDRNIQLLPRGGS